MTELCKDKRIRTAAALLLVLMIVVLSVFAVPRADAVEKTLSVTPGKYIRWRRGLPPEDGNWYRIILATQYNYAKDYYFMRGNTLAEYGGERNARVVIPKEGGSGVLKTVIPGFDLANDVNYTLNYYNTPAIRFAKYDSLNDHDRPAPMYYFRLSDWDGDDGKLTDTGMVTSGFTNDLTTPWAFVTNEHDSDVYKNSVVIEQFRSSGFFGSSFYLSCRDDYHVTPEGKTFISDEDKTPVYSFFIEKMGFSVYEDFKLYYADEITIDTIADGQSIEDDEIVNISGSNYLTLGKGSTLTIKDGGILSIGSGLYNDGTIKVEKGGTLIVQSDAFIMPWVTNSGAGNVICDGGDVIVYSGGKLVCEGASGFKMAGSDRKFGTVYNYGLIMATNLTLTGKARSVHNEGSIVVGWVVEPKYAQTFRDTKISPRGSDISSVPGLKATGHLTYNVGSGVITGYTSPLVK